MALYVDEFIAPGPISRLMDPKAFPVDGTHVISGGFKTIVAS